MSETVRSIRKTIYQAAHPSGPQSSGICSALAAAGDTAVPGEEEADPRAAHLGAVLSDNWEAVSGKFQRNRQWNGLR